MVSRERITEIVADVAAGDVPLHASRRIAKLEMELARARKERDQLRTLVEVVLIAAPVVLEGIDDGQA